MSLIRLNFLQDEFPGLTIAFKDEEGRRIHFLADESEENGTRNLEVELKPGLLGGKGGFGSMLRAMGASISKTSNTEACRDLSGRR